MPTNTNQTHVPALNLSCNIYFYQTNRDRTYISSTMPVLPSTESLHYMYNTHLHSHNFHKFVEFKTCATLNNCHSSFDMQACQWPGRSPGRGGAQSPGRRFAWRFCPGRGGRTRSAPRPAAACPGHRRRGEAQPPDEARSRAVGKQLAGGSAW